MLIADLIMRSVAKVAAVHGQNTISGVKLIRVTGRTSFEYVLDEDAGHGRRTEAAAIRGHGIDLAADNGYTETFAGYTLYLHLALWPPVLRAESV